jgi:predicted neuraminidase
MYVYTGKVRPTGDGRYEAYMIPPFQSNHASFLELLPTGDLLLAWFSGTKEGHSGVAIVVARLPNGTDQWTKAGVVSRRDGYSNQNPVLFYDNRTKILHLFHSQQPGSKLHLQARSSNLSAEYDAKIWTLNSTNLGSTWSPPYEQFRKDGSFDRNRVIRRLDGDWMLPIYYSVHEDKDQTSSIQRTSTGTSWTEYAIEGSNYLVQPSVIRPTPGKELLYVYMRDRRAQHIYKSESADDGKEWTKPEKTEFPNNNAGIQARTLMNQHIVLVYNPTTGPRHPIRISLSEDGGKTWPYYRDLESGDGPEYSYPCILQTPDEYIHVTYTFNRKTIKYVKFMEDWIKKKL